MVMPIGSQGGFAKLEEMGDCARRQYDYEVAVHSEKSQRLSTEMLAAHVARYESSNVLRRFAYRVVTGFEEPPKVRAHRNELEGRGINTR